ncbi:MAG: hypothetical protein HYZ75_09830 [Elusimicrobia bacterium]|nr:hypothetical protein [Elusimicrobiota bacterium]
MDGPAAPKGRHLAAVAAISLFVLWFGFKSLNRSDSLGSLDFAEVPQGSEKPHENYISAAEQELLDRQGEIPNALIPEGSARYMHVDPDKEKDEPKGKQVLAKKETSEVDTMVQKELVRLTKITGRYRKSEPKVKEVDLAFGKLPRYMAVRKKYLEDHDAYAFAHDAIKLPEVRKTIVKYAMDPKIWKVTLKMVTEGLRQKPPKPLYDEMKRFFTEDKEVRGFAADLSKEIAPALATKVLPQVLPQIIKDAPQDMAALKGLAKDLNIGANGVAPPPGGGPTSVNVSKKPSETHKGEKIAGTDIPALPDGELKIGEGSQRDQQISTLGKGDKPSDASDKVRFNR